jgi:hypothetical protein
VVGQSEIQNHREEPVQHRGLQYDIASMSGREPGKSECRSISKKASTALMQFTTAIQYSTVFVRISDMARISASFGLFYVLRCYLEMRHYFNDVKVPKNAQDQCEFEYLFIFYYYY